MPSTKSLDFGSSRPMGSSVVRHGFYTTQSLTEQGGGVSETCGQERTGTLMLLSACVPSKQDSLWLARPASPAHGPILRINVKRVQLKVSQPQRPSADAPGTPALPSPAICPTREQQRSWHPQHVSDVPAQVHHGTFHWFGPCPS